MATYNKETFKRLFQSKFNLSKWQMLLQDYFHADKVRVRPEVLDEDAEDRKGYFLGSMTTQDNYELGFFYYEMEDGSVLRRKVGLRNLIRPYLGYGFDAALAVFNDGTNWRLSLICDLKEDATSPSGSPMCLVMRRHIIRPLFRVLWIYRRSQMSFWKLRKPSLLRLFQMISLLLIAGSMPSL